MEREGDGLGGWMSGETGKWTDGNTDEETMG